MIKIIKGSYGMRIGGVIKPVKAGQCCELAKEEEERLVRIGVAEFVEVVDAEPKTKEPERAAAKPKASAELAESEAGPLPDMQGADAVVG